MIQQLTTTIVDFGLFLIKLDIALAYIVEAYAMSAFFTGFKNTFVAHQLRVAGQQSDIEPCDLAGERLVDLVNMAAVDVTAHKCNRRIHHHASKHGLASQQHSESHRVAVGQREFNWQLLVLMAQHGSDYIAFFSMTNRAFNNTLVDNLCLVALNRATFFLQILYSSCDRPHALDFNVFLSSVVLCA